MAVNKSGEPLCPQCGAVLLKTEGEVPRVFFKARGTVQAGLTRTEMVLGLLLACMECDFVDELKEVV